MPRDDKARETAGLPLRPFLYTVDQIATLVAIDKKATRRYLHYAGRSVGPRPIDKMLAQNIAAGGAQPDWRVAEHELLRWLRRKGFRVQERGWVNL